MRLRSSELFLLWDGSRWRLHKKVQCRRPLHHSSNISRHKAENLAAIECPRLHRAVFKAGIDSHRKEGNINREIFSNVRKCLRREK